MTEDDQRTADDEGNQRQRVDILDAVLAELEADDGARTAAFRRRLDLEPESTAIAGRLEAVED